MKKRTRSILQELNTVHKNKDKDDLIETTANNLIDSSMNLLNRIAESYDNDTASELERRFLNSIRTGDPRKFKRAMSKLIEGKKNESQ